MIPLSFNYSTESVILQDKMTGPKINDHTIMVHLHFTRRIAHLNKQCLIAQTKINCVP